MRLVIVCRFCSGSKHAVVDAVSSAFPHSIIVFIDDDGNNPLGAMDMEGVFSMVVDKRQVLRGCPVLVFDARVHYAPSLLASPLLRDFWTDTTTRAIQTRGATFVCSKDMIYPFSSLDVTIKSAGKFFSSTTQL